MISLENISNFMLSGLALPDGSVLKTGCPACGGDRIRTTGRLEISASGEISHDQPIYCANCKTPLITNDAPVAPCRLCNRAPAQEKTMSKGDDPHRYKCRTRACPVSTMRCVTRAEWQKLMGVTEEIMPYAAPLQDA